jgi:hypothetical protein
MPVCSAISFKSVCLLLTLSAVAPGLCAAGADPAPAGAFENHLPEGIAAPNPLRRHMDVMFHESATFRQQCRRLAVPGLYVRVKVDVQLIDKAYRAQTVITRSDSVIFAIVTLGAYGDPTEWLAHEFEHIIEQIEGARLAAMAEEPGGRAWRSGQDTFETARALQAGQLVKREVRQAQQPVGRAVGRLEPGARGDY